MSLIGQVVSEEKMFENVDRRTEAGVTGTCVYYEGLDGGSSIHYSLKFSPLFISLKFWVIH